jgi:hypothetical protein
LRTARIASSNTCLRPFWVRALHSMYLTAEISFCLVMPCSYEIGARFFSRRREIVSESSRKSSLVPTSSSGVLGQWCETSGNHLADTFSNDDGEMIEKQMRNTSVCGYDSGRRRS